MQRTSTRTTSTLLALFLLVLGSSSLAQTPQPAATAPTIEMTFVLDTTASMGGLLAGAKTKIWSIVNEVQKSASHPRVRIALVAFRDRGDAYETQILPMTEDLDRVYATLTDYKAQGGGDRPEDVRQGLAVGVQRAGWAPRSSSIVQILFLVGDAPPHDDYTDKPDTLVSAAEAAGKGIFVNTIQCGDAADTREVWQKIARRGEGFYFAIAQNGGVQAIATPFDDTLTQLGSKIGGTYLAYGPGKATKQQDQLALERRLVGGGPSGELADRAFNKAVNVRAYDEYDLIQSIETGKTTIELIKPEDLPDELRGLTPEAMKKEIDVRIEARKGIRAEILNVSKQRDEYVAAQERKTLDGFDAAVSEALRKQIASRGIKLE